MEPNASFPDYFFKFCGIAPLTLRSLALVPNTQTKEFNSEK